MSETTAQIIERVGLIPVLRAKSIAPPLDEAELPATRQPVIVSAPVAEAHRLPNVPLATVLR